LEDRRSTKISEQNYIAIESYGVRLRVYSGRPDILREIEARLPFYLPPALFRKIPHGRAVHTFSVRKNKAFEYVLFRGRKKITGGNDRENFLKYLDSQIRLTIAEYAESRVFLHAGVVEWKGKAIVLPARSFQGKTTLVKELTKLGAKYYSDDYAVLDEEGFVHPFAKTLSVRGSADKYRQVELTVESLGGKSGSEAIPVGMIMLTEFQTGARWRPQILSEGAGVLELLSHTIPIRYNPKFSLKVLNKTANRAIIIKTKRGEAKEFAVKLLSFFENRVF